MAEQDVDRPTPTPPSREWRQWADGPGGWLWTGVQWMWLDQNPDMAEQRVPRREHAAELSAAVDPDWGSDRDAAPDPYQPGAPVASAAGVAQQQDRQLLADRVNCIVAEEYPPLPVDGRRNRQMRLRYGNAVRRRLERGAVAALPFRAWRIKFHLVTHVGLWVLIVGVAYGPEWVTSPGNSVSGAVVFGTVIGLSSGLCAVVASLRSDRTRARYLQWRESIYALKAENDARLRELGIDDV